MSLFTYALSSKWVVDLMNMLGYNVEDSECGFSLIIGLCNSE
jgi:hypothetical protein